MDKEFWRAVKADGYKIPADQTAAALTEELFSYLGSPDPELRDSVAYEVFANWLEQRQFSADMLRGYVLRLVVNLQEGLGERDSDSVLLRAFSVLCLAEIVYHENQHPFMDRDELHSILDRGLEYLEAEQDPRGYIPEKGWAHALAHTADLLLVLAENPKLGREELTRILDGVRDKLARPTDWVYIHGEDDRLGRAVMAVADRRQIDPVTLHQWLMSFTSPGSHSWRDSFKDDQVHRAFVNSKTFLRALHLRASQEESLEGRERLSAAILETLAALRQF